MMVHVSLRRTHHAFIKRDCQRLRVDMNHHDHPSEGHLGACGSGRLAAISAQIKVNGDAGVDV